MEFRRWRLGLAVLMAVPGVASATLFDRGDGLIYDDVLDITWLQDANRAQTSGYDGDGRMTWMAANTWASDLVYGGYSDWRLPTVVDTGILGCTFAYSGTDCGYNVQTGSAETTVYSEMASLFYDTLTNDGWFDASENPTGCSSSSPYCLSNTGPFSNIQPYFYWSGLENSASDAWDFHFGTGSQVAHNKDNEFFAWAVRSGDVTAQVPEPATLLLLGAGLVGVVSSRRARR